MPPVLPPPALCRTAFVHLHEFATSWQLWPQRSQVRNRHLSSFTLPYVLPTARGSEVKEPSSGTLHQRAAVIYDSGGVSALQRDGGASGAVGDGDYRHVKFMHSCHSEDGRGAAFKLWSQRLRSLKSDLYKCSATAWIKYPLSPWRLKFLFFRGGQMYFNWGGTEMLLQRFALIETRSNDSQVWKITPRGKYTTEFVYYIVICLIAYTIQYTQPIQPIIPQLTVYAAC